MLEVVMDISQLLAFLFKQYSISLFLKRYHVKFNRSGLLACS